MLLTFAEATAALYTFSDLADNHPHPTAAMVREEVALKAWAYVTDAAGAENDRLGNPLQERRDLHSFRLRKCTKLSGSPHM